MINDFDPTLYTRAPIISVSSGVTLAQTLVQSCPKSADAGTKKAAKHLKVVAEQALADMAERNQKLGAITDEDSRVVDNEADRAWGALRLRIQAAAMITEHGKDDAKRAADLDFKLFQGTTDFLKAEYGVQSSRMGAILKHIDSEDLASEIDTIAGKNFLAAVRDVQPRYEDMVKERLRRDKSVGQNLGDTVRNLQGAIVHYATKVCGSVELDDEATAETARVALLPILNHRDSATSKGSATTGASGTTPPAPPPAPPSGNAPTDPTTPTS